MPLGKDLTIAKKQLTETEIAAMVKLGKTIAKLDNTGKVKLPNVIPTEEVYASDGTMAEVFAGA